jgi:cell wall-associated NlpC family hydrolase
MGDMISQPARTLGNIGASIAVAAVLCACASQEPVTSRRSSTAAGGEVASQRPKNSLDLGERAAVVAVRQLGVPYRYGGSNQSGFDCSGLVHYAYSKAGKSIPRTTGGLWNELKPVSANNLRVGDLLFFNIDGTISHVGLYLGSRRFVHAPSTGRDVTIDQLDSGYYRKAFVRGGRP